MLFFVIVTVAAQVNTILKHPWTAAPREKTILWYYVEWWNNRIVSGFFDILSFSDTVCDINSRLFHVTATASSRSASCYLLLYFRLSWNERNEIEDRWIKQSLSCNCVCIILDFRHLVYILEFEDRLKLWKM